MEKVLTGVRVLDFSRWFAGPYAATLLAAMGAEVIRVERPAGEEERNFGPFSPNGQAMLALVTLQNRRGITLDPMSDKGKGILERLVQKSDVLLHSYVSGSPEESLLSYESLVQFNPAIIVAKVSGFGSTGPYAQRPCFDTIAQALSGSMSYTGFPETAPTRSGSAWVDFSTGSHAALGIMFALYDRQRTGKGQFIDVALLDVAVACVAGLAVAAEYKVGGIIRGQQGNASYYNFTNCLKAKDGWVVIGVGNSALFRALVTAMGQPELGRDPRFKAPHARLERHDEVNGLVADWVKDRSVDEVMTILGPDGANVPCAPVMTVDRLLADPHLRAREMVVELPHAKLGRIPVTGVPYHLSESPGHLERLGPELGEHNEEVYRGQLGLSADDLEALRREGVI